MTTFENKNRISQALCSLVSASVFKCVAKSRMSGDVHVRFCEKLGVKIPRLSRLAAVPAGAHASANLYSLVESAKDFKNTMDKSEWSKMAL